ncbi:unnamed protein product [marine sediment metagenome]|uniref:Uncharacterized protein n=1 Tax=marine sediment metagenome TaxID=412755 RepID=X1IK82_9ZZZZ
MQLIWYFMALKVTETIALAMIGFQVSIILVALYEHGIKSEKLDIFKILYLLLLVVSIGIIINVKSQEAALHGTGFSLNKPNTITGIKLHSKFATMRLIMILFCIILITLNCLNQGF